MDSKIYAGVLGRLRAITEGCRPDMHEPDNQDIKARIVGTILDNACGESIRVEAIEGGYQEYVVILERFRNCAFEVERFNLADLIALARENTSFDLKS